jgi:O-glycosyl hydrolase
MMAGLPPLHAADLTVTPSTRFQTIRGFGGGIAYYQGWLTSHPQKQAIYDTVFTGLGLSYLRVGNWNQDTTSQLAEDSTLVAEAKKRLGARLHLFMSSWSAPGYMKVSGQTSGMKNGVQLPQRENTLKKVNGAYAYDQFAHWWLRSVQKFAAKGMRPDDISIQNEPDMNAGYESMVLAPTQNDSVAGYAQALKAVSDSLAKLGSRPNLYGPEVLGITNRNAYGPWEANFAMFARRLDASLLSGYAYHLYDAGGYGNPDGFLPFVRDSIANKFPGKPIVMSEYCNMDGVTGSAADMLSGARVILNSLVYGNLGGYIYWNLIWGDAGNMINVNNPWNSGSWKTANGFQVNPEYHGMRHFSKFIAPGWSRVAASSNDGNVKVAAFANPAGDSMTVVAINIAGGGIAFNAAPPGFSPRQVWQSEVNGPKSVLVPSAANQTSFALPASSLTTIVYVAGCAPSAITAWTQVNGTWQNNASATVDPGATVMFGPQPVTGGSWSWNGPNGFGASSREITISNIASADGGDYVATYTNPSGCKSTQVFTITVRGTAYSGTLAIRARGLCGSEEMRLLIGDNVVKTWSNVGKNPADYNYAFANQAAKDDVKVQFTNDAASRKCDRSLWVDYIKIGSSVLQGESQPINTGTCGAIAPSEWLFCNGHIDFANSDFSIGTAAAVSTGSGQAVGIRRLDATRPGFTVQRTAQGVLLNLHGFGGNAEVGISGLNGISVYRNRISGNSLAIPELKKGVYILNLKTDQIQLSGKFILN